MMNVDSCHLEKLKLPEQFLSFSKAYIESARILCTRLIDKPEKTSYERGCVVMYVAYHAVELFLKATILKREPDTKLHHVLDDLGKEYHRIYPKPEYRWAVPFNLEVLGYEPEEAKRIRNNVKKKMPEDQIFRYPTNKEKDLWNGVLAFEAKGFLEEIKKIESDFQRIEALIFSG
jgi:hypothetical protein